MLHVDVAIDIATRHPAVASPFTLHLFLATSTILDRATVQPTLEFGTFSATLSSSSPPSPQLEFSFITNELCSRATDATVSRELCSHGGLSIDHMVGEFRGVAPSHKPSPEKGSYTDVANYPPSPEKGFSTTCSAFRARPVPHEVYSTLVPPLPPLVFGTLFPIVNTPAVDTMSSKSTPLDVVPALDALDTSTSLRSALSTTGDIASSFDNSALPAALNLRADVSVLYSTDDYCETVNNALLFGSIITAGMQTELRSRGERSSLVTNNPSEKILSLRSITAGMQTELCSRVEHSNLETFYKKKKKILLLRSITAGLQTELCSRGERGSQETINILPSLIPIAAIEQSELCSRVETCFVAADSELQRSPPLVVLYLGDDITLTTCLLIRVTSSPLTALSCDTLCDYLDPRFLATCSNVNRFKLFSFTRFKFARPLQVVARTLWTLTSPRTTLSVLANADDSPCICHISIALPALLPLTSAQTEEDLNRYLALTRGLSICLPAGVFVSLRRSQSSLMLECRSFALSGLVNYYFLHSHHAVASYLSRFTPSIAHLLTEDGIVDVSPQYHVLQVLNPNLAVVFGLTEVDSRRPTRFSSPQFLFFTELDAADTTLAMRLPAIRHPRYSLLTADWNYRLEHPWPGCNPAKVTGSPQPSMAKKAQPPDRSSSTLRELEQGISRRYITPLTSRPMRFINAYLLIHLEELLLIPSLHDYPSSFINASVGDFATFAYPSTTVLSYSFPTIEVFIIPCYYPEMSYRDPFPSSNPGRYLPASPTRTRHHVRDAMRLSDPGSVLELIDAILNTLAVPVVLSYCFAESTPRLTNLARSTYMLYVSDVADSRAVVLATSGDLKSQVYGLSFCFFLARSLALALAPRVTFVFRCQDLALGTWSSFFSQCFRHQCIQITLPHAALLPFLAQHKWRHSHLQPELLRRLVSDVIASALTLESASRHLQVPFKRFQRDSRIRQSNSLRNLDRTAICHTTTRRFPTSDLFEYRPCFDNRIMTARDRLRSSTRNVCVSNTRLWVGRARMTLQSSTSIMEVDSFFAIIALIHTAFTLSDNHMYWNSCITDCIDIPNLLHEYFEHNEINSALRATVARTTRPFSNIILTRLTPPTCSLSHALSAIVGNPLGTDCSNSQSFVSRKLDKENLRQCPLTLRILPALSHPAHLESQSASKLLWLTNTALLLCIASSISSDMRMTTDLEQDFSIAYMPPSGAPLLTLAVVFGAASPASFSDILYTCLQLSAGLNSLSPKTTTVIPDREDFAFRDPPMISISRIPSYHILHMFSDLPAFSYWRITFLANLLFLFLFCKENVCYVNSIIGATYHNAALADSGLPSPSLHNHIGTSSSARNIITDICLSIGHPNADLDCQPIGLVTGPACYFLDRRAAVFPSFESLTRLCTCDNPISINRLPTWSDIPLRAICSHNAIVWKTTIPPEFCRCNVYKLVSGDNVLVLAMATIYGFVSSTLTRNHLKLHIAMPIPNLTTRNHFSAQTFLDSLPAVRLESIKISVESSGIYGFANTLQLWPIQEGEFSALQAQPVLGDRVRSVATIDRSLSPADRSTHVLTILETSFPGGYQATITSSPTLRASTCALPPPLEGGFPPSLQWRQVVHRLPNGLPHRNNALNLSLHTAKAFHLRSPSAGSRFNALVLPLVRRSRMMITNRLLSNSSECIESSSGLYHALLLRICSQSIIFRPQIYSSTRCKLNACDCTSAYRFVDVNPVMRIVDGMFPPRPNQGLLSSGCTSPYLVSSPVSEVAGILREPVTATSAPNLGCEMNFLCDVSLHLVLVFLTGWLVTTSTRLLSLLLRTTFDCVLFHEPMRFGYLLLVYAVIPSVSRLGKDLQISCSTLAVISALDMFTVRITYPGSQRSPWQFSFPAIQSSTTHPRCLYAHRLAHKLCGVISPTVATHPRPGITWFVRHISAVSATPRQLWVFNRLMANDSVTLLSVAMLVYHGSFPMSLLGYAGLSHLHFERSTQRDSFRLPSARFLCIFFVFSPWRCALTQLGAALSTAACSTSRRLSDLTSVLLVTSFSPSVTIRIFVPAQSLLPRTLSSNMVMFWTHDYLCRRVQFSNASLHRSAARLDPAQGSNSGGLVDFSCFHSLRYFSMTFLRRPTRSQSKSDLASAHFGSPHASHGISSAVLYLFNDCAKVVSSVTGKSTLAEPLSCNAILQWLVNRPFPPVSTLRLCGHFLEAFCVYCACICSQSMVDEYMHPLSEPDLRFCTALNQSELYSHLSAIVLLSDLTLLTLQLFSRHALLSNATSLARNFLVAVIALALYAALRSSQSGVHFRTHRGLLVFALFKPSLDTISGSLITCTIVALSCAGNAAFNRRIQYCLTVLVFLSPAICHLQMRHNDDLYLLQSELRQSLFVIGHSVIIFASMFVLYWLEHLSGCQMTASHLLALHFQPLHLDNRIQSRFYEICHRTALDDTRQRSTSFFPISRYLRFFLHSVCISLREFAPRTWRLLCWLASTCWMRFRALSSLPSIKLTRVIERLFGFILFDFPSAFASIAEYYGTATLVRYVYPFSVLCPKELAAAQQRHSVLDARSLLSKWYLVRLLLVISSHELGSAGFNMSNSILVLRSTLDIAELLWSCIQRIFNRFCLVAARMEEYHAMKKGRTFAPFFVYFSVVLVCGLRLMNNCIRYAAIIVHQRHGFRLSSAHPSCHSLSRASQRNLTCTYHHAQKCHQYGDKSRLGYFSHARLSQIWYVLWQPTGIYLPRRRLCFSYVFASEEIGLFCLPCDSAGVDSHSGFQIRLPSSNALRPSLCDALSFALYYLSHRMVNSAYDTAGNFVPNFMACSPFEPFKAAPLKLIISMSIQVQFGSSRFSSSLPVIITLVFKLLLDEYASRAFPSARLFSSAFRALAPASAIFFKFVAAITWIKTQTALLHVWLSTRAVQWLRTFFCLTSRLGRLSRIPSFAIHALSGFLSDPISHSPDLPGQFFFFPFDF